MIKVKAWSGEAVIRMTNKLEVITLTRNLHAFRLTKAKTVDERVGKLIINANDTSTAVSEGFIDKKNLANLRAGQNWKSLNDVALLPLDIIERARTDGWHATFKQFRNWPSWEGSQFEALKNGTATEANVVRIAFSSWRLFDYVGEPLPVAISFNYMDGWIDNVRYDLTKAAKHLRGRKDVVLFRAETEDTQEKLNAEIMAGKNDPVIARIPHYNCSDSRSQHIAFRFMPTVKQYRSLCETAGSQKYPDLRKAVFEMDMLGLRKAGAAKFDSYHGSPEREPVYEEET